LADDSSNSEISPSRPSLADAIDLLDLVRSSEDAARISTEAPPMVTKAPAPAQDFVDIGDDAEDAPPSLPPQRTSTRPRPPSLPPVDAPVPRRVVVVAEPAPEATMPPSVGIILVFGLTIAMLYGILALPSFSSSSRPEPANLQLQRSAE